MFQYKVAPIIHTDRLLIRIASIDDAKDYYEFCSDPLVCTYLTFNPYKSLSHTKVIINNMINAYIHGTDVNFSVVLKSNHKVIGSVSLNFKEKTNIAEIGYLFNSSYWKNGYANEAIKVLIKVAFDYYNVNVIEAKYLLENIASKNLLKKNEFIIDEIIKDGFIKNNRKYDLVKCYKSKL